MKLELTNEQLDAICLALANAEEARENTGWKSDLEVAKVFKQVREYIRKKEPHNASMKRLMKGVK